MLVLVGLPGAGKSTVGRLAAERMGWAFVDLDALVVEQAGGTSIPRLFAEEGEPAFRARERRATESLVGRRELVVASGGGWMANPGCPELLRPPARIIHLHVGVPAALERLALSRDPRPLLAVADPASALGALAERRAAAYAGADAVLDTEVLDLQQLVEKVARLAAAPGAG